MFRLNPDFVAKYNSSSEVLKFTPPSIIEEAIKTKNEPKNAGFFVKNADNSIDSAKALFDLSTDPKKQENMFILKNFS